MQFKFIPAPPWTVLGVTSQIPFTYPAHIKNFNFVTGLLGKMILYEAVFMSVFGLLAANFIQKQCEKGRCPKAFCAPKISHLVFLEISVKCYGIQG